MTLFKNASGIYEGDFRFAGFDRLRLSMATTKKGEASARYEAVRLLFRQKRHDLIAQLRLPKRHRQRLTVERLAAMVKADEPLTPMSAADDWGTVRQQVERYLAWLAAHPNRAKGTHKSAKAALSRFMAFEYQGVVVGDMLFEKVTSAIVEAYQQHLVAEGAKPNTILLYMSRVGALWRWTAKREERASREERRPMRPVYLPIDSDMVIRDVTSRDRMLSEDEATRLLAATPAPLLFPIACGLFAGFRYEEMSHLRPDADVDLELGTLRVQRQQDWKPKTKRSIRTVPIAAPLRPILERHLVRYASERWVVPSLSNPDRPMPDSTFAKHFQEIVERAGMVYGQKDPAGVVFHTLRHTFASWLAMRGVDLYAIAQLLGDSLQMVEKTYAHLSPDFKRQAIERLAGLTITPTLPDEATTGAD